MNTVSLSGMIVSVPTVTTVDKGLNYTSFRIRVHAAYLDDAGDAYTYVDEHTIICVGQLENMRTLPAVAAAMANGSLRIHGWIYDIAKTEITAFDPIEGAFRPLRSSDDRLPDATPHARFSTPLPVASAA